MSVVMTNKYKKYIWVSLIIGMITGVFLFILKRNKLFFEDNIIYINDYIKNINSSDYPIYIIRQRIILLLVYFIIILLTSYKISICILNSFFGIFYGIVSCDLFCDYGIKSYLIIFVLFIPHFILYIYCFYLMGKYFFTNDNNYLNKFNFFVKIILIAILLCAGVCFEIFFQKNFIRFLPISSIKILC